MLHQVVVAACEKYPGKFDVAAKMIKEASLFRLYVMLDERSARKQFCIENTICFQSTSLL